ncbi:GNAT family N-acetyltransferase, partial [Pradoshia sp.]
MIIRQANSSDAPSIARVNVESWHSTYKGIVPKRYLEAMSAEQYAKKWGRIIENPASIVLVAEIDSQVIGYISGGMER